MKKIFAGTVLGIAALGIATGAQVGSDLETALGAGATRLTSDEIATRIVGKTVTAALGEKRFLFHYSEDNVLSGQLVGGDWSDTGYYGITDDNRICLSMTTDKGRFRCLTLYASNLHPWSNVSAGPALRVH